MSLFRRLILDTSADSEKEENMVEWLREVSEPTNKIMAQYCLPGNDGTISCYVSENNCPLSNFLPGWHACRFHQQVVQNVPRHQSQRGLEQPVQGTAEGPGHKNRRLGMKTKITI